MRALPWDCGGTGPRPAGRSAGARSPRPWAALGPVAGGARREGGRADYQSRHAVLLPSPPRGGRVTWAGPGTTLDPPRPRRGAAWRRGAQGTPRGSPDVDSWPFKALLEFVSKENAYTTFPSANTRSDSFLGKVLPERSLPTPTSLPQKTSIGAVWGHIFALE